VSHRNWRPLPAMSGCSSTRPKALLQHSCRSRLVMLLRDIPFPSKARDRGHVARISALIHKIAEIISSLRRPAIGNDWLLSYFQEVPPKCVRMQQNPRHLLGGRVPARSPGRAALQRINCWTFQSCATGTDVVRLIGTDRVIAYEFTTWRGRELQPWR